HPVRRRDDAQQDAAPIHWSSGSSAGRSLLGFTLGRCRSGSRCRRSRSLTTAGGRLQALLCLGTRLALLGLLAALARLHHLGRRQELGDTVARLGTDLEPVRDALLVERDALGVLARQQRIVGAELLDEAAVARAARI